MDPLMVILVAFVALGVGVSVALVISRHTNSGDFTRGLADARREAGEAADRLAAHQAELTGRLAQFAESQTAHQARLADLMRAQEREVGRKLEERLAEVTRKLGEGLEKSRTQQQTTMGDLKERLAVIDSAQKNITELSNQVVSLQDILSNKQARGAFGEVQLSDLVRSTLPPNAYEFQAAVGSGKRADCLLKLPNPPGTIAIDAKFPLESYYSLCQAEDDTARIQARKALARDVLKHVRDIAERYIVPGETAESALMFLPSETVYAELHANLPDVIEKSWRARVWIVSPTTLMATLNTVRAVLKDARMREQAHVIQKEVTILLGDLDRLDVRVGRLESHFRQAEDDIRQIRISTDKITKRGDRIQEIEVGEEDGSAENPMTLAPPDEAVPALRSV